MHPRVYVTAFTLNRARSSSHPVRYSSRATTSFRSEHQTLSVSTTISTTPGFFSSDTRETWKSHFSSLNTDRIIYQDLLNQFNKVKLTNSISPKLLNSLINRHATFSAEIKSANLFLTSQTGKISEITLSGWQKVVAKHKEFLEKNHDLIADYVQKQPLAILK